VAPLAVVLLAGCGGGEAPGVLPVRVAQGDATAFAIGDGRAVTVAHVLRAGRPVRVAARRARVLRVDRRLDVAVLATGAGRGSAARGGAARAGDRVTVRVLRSGAVRALRATVRRTIAARVRSPGGAVRARPALELAAAVMRGDSGAPVLDGDGRVLGVVFASADGIAYAVIGSRGSAGISSHAARSQ
jgi:S1-C subfamily serine protease